MSSRLNRTELFMGIADLYSQRSSCLRANVGCVAVIEGRPIAAGYCGAPQGMAHCTEAGCTPGPDDGCLRSVHAEANMIAWAARTGVSLKRSWLYTTHMPCLGCAKLIANSGIMGVIYRDDYRVTDGADLLIMLDISVDKWMGGLEFVSLAWR